ncbi:hypothetical protein [Streptomyces sp. NBC_01763]|uniref:hypothetical protein n=1 Tax=Streptomyces sp. NBC_01763 TaxID=2975934 RepID=UPI002DDAA298|nr:hypothetical protein [Streptomyces sp. NBC_01763]WSC40975.1 hypothetical protein OHA08_38865 [Streptomyces sp. NBC_01763]
MRPSPAQPEEPQEEGEPAASPWPTGHRFAERTRAKHATIHVLLAAGHSKRSIASPNTSNATSTPVTAGLTPPWNSGVVEGQVNRIKMLKRQMFGRAGFEFLRKRVLLA